jgi:hypothetical protein
VWSEGGGGEERESKMKGKQNDKRKRISEGKSERVGEDIRGFNEMLCGLKGQQVRRSKV